MRIKKYFKIVLLFVTLLGACNWGINIFRDVDDVKMGMQFDREIRKNTKEYPIYKKNPAVKRYITQRIFNHILNSPAVKKRRVYNYKLEIIDNDKILNAFAVPGGYVYIYTGLIKYLDSEAALAGVLGHEIAHVERRHATQRITQVYGLQIAASIALGENPTQIGQIAANLLSGLTLLANSRAAEDEADKYSIEFLRSTRYYPGAVKFFFEKLRDEGKIAKDKSGLETFLSTHPDPIDRIRTTEKRLKALHIPIKTWRSNGKGIFKKEYKKNILDRI
jgi:predicted Zn-dependent protease